MAHNISAIGGVSRLCAKLEMFKSGLICPKSCTLTLRRHNTYLDTSYFQEDMKILKRELYRMGLEYHNKVKNSFHLKNIINIRKKSLAQVRFEPQYPGPKASHKPT